MTRRRTRKLTNQRGSRRDQAAVLHNDMKELVELQKAQEIRFRPEIMDVPRIRIKHDKVYSVELSFQQTTTLSTSVFTSGSIVFSLGATALGTTYASIFDQYRIVQANVKILPQGVSTAGGNVLYTVLDYDDPNPPTAIGTLLSYANLKITPSGQIEERTLNPRIATAAYAGATFNGYANMPSTTWIDAASSGVQYYGLKYYTPVGANGSSLLFIVTMLVQFKSQHG